MSSQDYQAQAAAEYSYTRNSLDGSSSSSNDQNGGNAHTGTSNATYATTDPSTVDDTTTQAYDDPDATADVRRFGPDGRELPSSASHQDSGEGGGRPRATSTTGTSNNTVEEVAESEADREYRERMEDEYAKREGGA